MRYFVSYVVVKGHDTNSGGHVYTVFSELNEKSRKARIEVTNALGLYGHSLSKENYLKKAIFPAEIIGPGHLIQEQLRYIAKSDKYYHYHATAEITQDQRNALLDSYATDRGEAALPKRDFVAEKRHWDNMSELASSSDPDSASKLKDIEYNEYMNINTFHGPQFNAVRYSCMTDAKKRMADVGIDVSHISAFRLDIPSFSMSSLDKMLLEYNDGKLYWESPLTISLKNAKLSDTPERANELFGFYCFKELLACANKLLTEFSAMNNRLATNIKALEPLQQAQSSIEKMVKKYKRISIHPNQINPRVNQDFAQELIDMVSRCGTDMHKMDTDDQVLKFLRKTLNIFYNLFSQLCSWVSSRPNHHLGNPYDFVYGTCDTVEQLLRQLSSEKNTLDSALKTH